MQSKTTRLVAKFFAVLLVVTVLSSCNRHGSGCPNNDFKVIPAITLPFAK